MPILTQQNQNADKMAAQSPQALLLLGLFGAMKTSPNHVLVVWFLLSLSHDHQ